MQLKMTLAIFIGIGGKLFICVRMPSNFIGTSKILGWLTKCDDFNVAFVCVLAPDA